MVLKDTHIYIYRFNFNCSFSQD